MEYDCIISIIVDFSNVFIAVITFYNADNNTGASRPNKELAYGEQNQTRLRRAITQALSKFGSDIHTPGHIEYLHTKFHHRTTSNKKVQKRGLRPYRAKNDHAPWY